LSTITYSETLITTHCYCGIAVAIPENLHRWMHESSDNSCYCPNGHQFHFGDTYKQKYERERRRAEANRDLLAAEERSHAATRGHLTRAKKRSAAGTCPCCNRTFKQLSRHMKVRHPEFVQEQLGEAALAGMEGAPET
jgi:hypothetical protein